MIREDCEYFPCHECMDDCTMCYCPIYPCKLTGTGGKWIRNKKTGKKTWDCSNCNIVHLKDTIKDMVEQYIKDCKGR